MNNPTINPEELVKYEHINEANPWEGHGKRRIYLETDKWNGGKHWNGGRGYEKCFIDLDELALVAMGEAGAATRTALRPTLNQIAEDFELTLRVYR